MDQPTISDFDQFKDVPWPQNGLFPGGDAEKVVAYLDSLPAPEVHEPEAQAAAFEPYFRQRNRLWDPHTDGTPKGPKVKMMAVARHISEAHEDGIWSCVWTPRGEIATGSVDETLNVWDAQSLAQKASLKPNRLGVVSVVHDTKGAVLATSSIDSVIRFWDAESKELKGSIDAGPVEAWTLSYHPDDKTVCSGTQKGTINVWDVEQQAKTTSFKGTTGADAKAFVMSVAYSPDGATIATGGLDGSVGIYDAKTGSQTAKFEAHELPVRSVAWTPDGQVLLSACDDSNVMAFDVGRPGKPFEVFNAHASWALGVAASPDNRHFATCSSDRTVKIWDLNTKNCVAALEGHQDQVWAVAYSPDGNDLVSCSDDASIQLYSIAAATAKANKANEDKAPPPTDTANAPAPPPAN